MDLFLGILVEKSLKLQIVEYDLMIFTSTSKVTQIINNHKI